MCSLVRLYGQSVHMALNPVEGRSITVPCEGCCTFSVLFCEQRLQD